MYKIPASFKSISSLCFVRYFVAAPRRNAAAVMLAGSLKAGLDWVVQLLLSPFLVRIPLSQALLAVQ